MKSHRHAETALTFSQKPSWVFSSAVYFFGEISRCLALNIPTSSKGMTRRPRTLSNSLKSWCREWFRSSRRVDNIFPRRATFPSQRKSRPYLRDYKPIPSFWQAIFSAGYVPRGKRGSGGVGPVNSHGE